MRRRIVLGVAVALALVAVVALAGGRWLAPTGPDDLSGWQVTPMAPDPALSEAARTDQACQTRSLSFVATAPPPLVLPMHVVLQDRRTARTAAFVVTTVGYAGACIVSPATQGAGWLTEEPLPDMANAIVVDGWADGGLMPLPSAPPPWEQYFIAWGRATSQVTSVRVDLGGPLGEVDSDDRVVNASVGGGWWLAWWPDPGLPRVVTGLDRQGAVVVALKLMEDNGWLAQ